MTKSEEMIAKYFAESGFNVQRFSKAEMMEMGKTPDFKVFKEASLILFCEVKEINEDNRQFIKGAEKDNTYNTISDCISDSYKQFESVNSKHKVPNVLAIYSRRTGIDITDFKITFEGGFHTEDNKFLPWVKNVSEGRIRDRKTAIDMCLWYDEFGDSYKWMLNSDSEFYSYLKSIIDPKNDYIQEE